MKRLKTLTFICVLLLTIPGCSTISDESELTKLNKEELHDLVIGNTTTQSTDYGRWADYHASEETSYARAWGDWGQQDVKSRHVTDKNGTMCHKYIGPYDWAGPDHEYCGVLYKDRKGNYYYETLKDTNNRDNVGTIFELEVKSGDPYGLAD